MSGDGGSRTRSSSVQARCSATRASSPGVRTGGVEPPQREAAGLQPVELADAQRPRAGWGGRPDSNRYLEAHNLGCWPLHHGHHEAGTTGLEPAASRLTSECSALLSYAPSTASEDSRFPDVSAAEPGLAGAAAGQGSEKRGWDSTPRSRAHEAREDSLSSTAQVWPAGIEPALSGSRSRRGSQHPLRPDVHREPPAGLEPAASGLRARRHDQFDHGGVRAPAAGLEPASRD